MNCFVDFTVIDVTVMFFTTRLLNDKRTIMGRFAQKGNDMGGEHGPDTLTTGLYNERA